MGFTQYFGSALQVTPHLHVLLPEGLWVGSGFIPLPPPSEEQVLAILVRLVKQLTKDFEGLELGWPEDGHQALQSEGVQHRLPLGESTGAAPRGRRLAVVNGFSLHADTAVRAFGPAGAGAPVPIWESRAFGRGAALEEGGRTIRVPDQTGPHPGADRC